jgi:excisionase family DNA binding protein
LSSSRYSFTFRGEPCTRRTEFREAPYARARENPVALTLPPEFVDEVADRVVELLAEQLAPADPDPYLSVDQAARYLACKPKRVYDLCSQRRIPFVKDGSRTLLRRGDLDAYLEGGSAWPRSAGTRLTPPREIASGRGSQGDHRLPDPRVAGSSPASGITKPLQIGDFSVPAPRFRE